MREQSHKQEMSAAVRGDFARLRARGVASTIAPVDDGTTGTESATEEPHDGETAPIAPPERRSFLRRLHRR